MGGVFAERRFNAGADEHVEVFEGNPFDGVYFVCFESELVVLTSAVGKINKDEFFVGGIRANKFKVAGFELEADFFLGFAKSGGEWVFADVDVAAGGGIVEATVSDVLGTFLEENVGRFTFAFDEPDASATFELAGRFR